MALQAQSPRLKVGVAKSRINSIDAQRSNAMAWRKRCQILLVAIQIHDGIGVNRLSAVGENVLPARRIDARQLVRGDLKPVGNRSCWSRGKAGIDGKWSRPRERVVL